MRVASLEDVDGIARILNAHLGEVYTTADEVAQLIERKDWVFYVVDNFDGDIVAVTSGHYVEKTQGLRDYLNEHWATVEKSVTTTGPVLLIKSVAVDDDYRGRGLASDLVRHVMQWGRHQDCTAVVSIGWTDAEGCHIQPVFDRLGINALMDIENFWTKGSLELGYLCPSCGNPCHCTARLFLSELSAPGRYPITFRA